MMTKHWKNTGKTIQVLSHCNGTKVLARWMRSSCDPERRLLKLVEIEDARMASSVTEMLMGTEVPPRKAFIYENATEAELDI